MQQQGSRDTCTYLSISAVCGAIQRVDACTSQQCWRQQAHLVLEDCNAILHFLDFYFSTKALDGATQHVEVHVYVVNGCGLNIHLVHLQRHVHVVTHSFFRYFTCKADPAGICMSAQSVEQYVHGAYQTLSMAFFMHAMY